MELPFVSVIVPCREEREWIAPCLASILASDYPAARMEVVVADGMSMDGTREAVEAYAARDSRIRLIDNPERITPAALNRAIERARGEIIARVDAHATIAPEYLRRAVGYLNSTGADNVGGTMHTVARDSGWFAKSIRLALTHWFGVGNSRFRTGAETPQWVDTVFGGCWRRQVFERVGKFNEKLERSQDMEFNVRLRRAGGRILLAPDLETRYYARTNLRAFLRHNWTNGVWAVLPFAYSEVVPVRPRHLAPLVFVTALAAAMAGVAGGWLPAWVLVAVAGPYLIVNLAVSAALAFKERAAKLMLLAPVAFGGLHLVYGAGSLWGALRLGGMVFKKVFENPKAKESSCDAG
jgi:glycosyltransferase involved in cell wall biosynthesis